MYPRLRELCPMARGSQDAGITQPRDHSLADPCMYVYVPFRCASFLVGQDARTMGQWEAVAIFQPFNLILHLCLSRSSVAVGRSNSKSGPTMNQVSSNALRKRVGTRQGLVKIGFTQVARTRTFCREVCLCNFLTTFADKMLRQGSESWFYFYGQY